MKVPCEKRPRETSSEAVPYVSMGPGPKQMKTTFLVKGRVVVNPRVEREWKSRPVLKWQTLSL